MIDPAKLKSSNLQHSLQELEESLITEIENMLLSVLMEKKRIQLHGRFKEILEYLGRTNYKISLRRPNKEIWSVTFKDFREAIRKVLRTGTAAVFSSNDQKEPMDVRMAMLLHILPENEYQIRSFIGNTVIHPNWGTGKLVCINENGNVQVEFKDQIVKLKPEFVELKVT